MILTKLDVTLIINDDAEGWQLEDFWDYADCTKEVWFHPATHMYLMVHSVDGDPDDWYEVKPVDVTCVEWEEVVNDEASPD